MTGVALIQAELLCSYVNFCTRRPYTFLEALLHNASMLASASYSLCHVDQKMVRDIEERKA